MESIFFSYAGTNRDTATRLKQGLVAAGAELWQDVDQIHRGDQWIDTLQEALQHCSAYVILLGSGGVKNWVKAELDIAIKRHFDSNGGFPIYPLLLSGVTPEDLPPFLSLFQAERVPAEPNADDYRRLAQRLSGEPCRYYPKPQITTSVSPAAAGGCCTGGGNTRTQHPFVSGIAAVSVLNKRQQMYKVSVC
jgi:hypothetical protein